jgi:transposase
LSTVTVVGLDLAKHVFQVHCVDAAGKGVLNRSLRRREVMDFFRKLPLCRVGLEALRFKRNDQMLSLMAIGILIFPDAGIQDKLADKARKLGIAVYRFGSGSA